ncbi:hypothetical protein KC19_10G034000 [Ceratodon purpureus]|uniref:Uncharacterized protein n=1 Tax=Ceratodon purpureus TaxID=3225 RepID=A0A8T0GIZ0_CERPU|nr:hypothetical protein KC19_10G034000 [Ceratodon purpureus]
MQPRPRNLLRREQSGKDLDRCLLALIPLHHRHRLLLLLLLLASGFIADSQPDLGERRGAGGHLDRGAHCVERIVSGAACGAQPKLSAPSICKPASHLIPPRLLPDASRFAWSLPRRMCLVSSCCGGLS